MKNEKIVIGSIYPLRGLLTLPDNTEEKLPAVVLVHGSGASNMDEKVMKLTPFKDLAEGLADKGIASVRYDKRTFAHARKMMKAEITVEEETIEDAILAAELLRKDERIDHDRIFIIGHSMGAMLAPRIDAEGGNFRGLVLMAGTPRKMEEIVLRQMKQAGNSNSLMKWIGNLEYKLFARKFDGLYEMSDAEAKKKKFAGNVNLYYFREMGQKTADRYLLENDKPVLIMQGGMDFQVLADDDFRLFKQLLKDRENTEYRFYPELNHCFVKGIYNDILKASKEYSVEQHIPEEVIQDIADFIKNN